MNRASANLSFINTEVSDDPIFQYLCNSPFARPTPSQRQPDTILDDHDEDVGCGSTPLLFLQQNSFSGMA